MLEPSRQNCPGIIRIASSEAVETMGFDPEEKRLASCFVDNGRAFDTDKRIVLSIELRERRLS